LSIPLLCDKRRAIASARELVGTGPAVIIVDSDWAFIPAHQATKSVPIVASPMGADPVAAGVAESWARPGGNVTGVTITAPELESKEPGEAPMREVAARLGIQLVELYVGGPDEYY
jgi:putative tryptophan/tyrosine transport system substrate-binding protein